MNGTTAEVLSTARDRIAVGWAVAATAVTALWLVYGIAGLVLGQWVACAIGLVLAAFFAIQVASWWQNATARVAVDASAVSRIGRGSAAWRVEWPDVARADVRTLAGRPYLCVEARTQPKRGAISRVFLWRGTPRRSVLAPLDPAAVGAVEAAIARSGPASP